MSDLQPSPDSPVPPASDLPPTTENELPFRRPADYYAAPVSEVKPLFPAWVPLGCGAASIAFLIVVFLGAALVSGDVLNQLFDFALGNTYAEMQKQYASDVTPAQKKSLEEKMERLREGVRGGKVSAVELRPVFDRLKDVVDDDSVSGEEIDRLIHAIEHAEP